MARTLNTMPYMLQRELLGRDWHECVSQRDLKVVSEYRRIENRGRRARDRQNVRNGNYDALPMRATARGSAAWNAY